MAGVLVFVEQDDAVALPQLPADLRAVGGQPGRGGHLAAEVHGLGRTHPGMQGVDQRNQGGALGLGVEHVQQPPVGPAALARTAGQGVHEPLEFDVGVAQFAGVDEVFGQFVGEPQHHRRHDGRGLADRQRIGMGIDDLEGELPPLGLAEQPGVGLHGQQRAELTQQRAGEGVVGADRRRSGRLEAEVSREPGQPRAHPAQQLSGGLPGERQPQHLTGVGVAVGHQPHHPGGHGFGLARTGAGDHHEGPRR